MRCQLPWARLWQEQRARSWLTLWHAGGEQRRLSIACALIATPSLIFLDEPTSGDLLLHCCAPPGLLNGICTPLHADATCWMSAVVLLPPERWSS